MSDNTLIPDENVGKEPAKFNMAKILLYADLGVEVAKSLSDLTKKVNAVVQSERITNVTIVIDKGLKVADQILDNKALIELLVGLFSSKTKQEFEENLTKGVLNFVTGS